MKSRVFILSTCRSEELLPAATLVFGSLRIGFPTAEVHVHINETEREPDTAARVEIIDRATKAGAASVRITNTNHHVWIETLLEVEESPFWILDTDVIFWKPVEHWPNAFTAPMAGRYIPGFNCEFTRAWTMPRLHTSLLWIDPVRVRSEMEGYYDGIPDTYFTPKPNLIYPQFVPEKVTLGIREWTIENTFFDTCSMLFNAILTQPFDEDQLDAYSHLNCGTIADLVGPRITDGKMQERHQAIFANPELARGSWRRDLEYYAERAG